MSDVTRQLEQDHREIMGHLDAIRAANYKREVAVQELRLAKGKILRHHAEEARAVYAPMLQDRACAAMATEFQALMQAISVDILAFFERYDLKAEATLGIEFAMDLSSLTQRLRTRIRQEEEQLYPLYRQELARTTVR
ncbi:MAG: hemerythrin domain-containing protein [Candidatus Sericytochromatia bacterium]|nr:hemerythrin domain-containing protein [Candidatus Sericytochromatia bacterium]